MIFLEEIRTINGCMLVVIFVLLLPSNDFIQLLLLPLKVSDLPLPLLLYYGSDDDKLFARKNELIKNI